MPLTGYVATLRLTRSPTATAPSPNGRRSSNATRAADLVNGIGTNVFQAGFDALKRHFAG